MELNWKSKAYEGNPVFNRDGNHLYITNKSSKDKGSWFAQIPIPENREITITANYNTGRVVLLYYTDESTKPSKTTHLENDTYKLDVPPAVQRVRLDYRLWYVAASGECLFTMEDDETEPTDPGDQDPGDPGDPGDPDTGEGPDWDLPLPQVLGDEDIVGYMWGPNFMLLNLSHDGNPGIFSTPFEVRGWFAGSTGRTVVLEIGSPFYADIPDENNPDSQPTGLIIAPGKINYGS